jgi:hypothetical protein
MLMVRELSVFGKEEADTRYPKLVHQADTRLLKCIKQTRSFSNTSSMRVHRADTQFFKFLIDEW